MTIAKRWGGVAIGMALMVQAGAASAANFCVTDREARAIGLFMAPDVLRAAAKICRPTLPADAYLARPTEMLTARYTVVGSNVWPEIKALVARIPDAKLLRDVDEKAIRAIFGPLVEDKLMGKIKPTDCASANEILTQLEPLPPENLMSVLVTIARLAEKDKKPATGSKTPNKTQIFCDPTATPTR